MQKSKPKTDSPNIPENEEYQKSMNNDNEFYSKIDEKLKFILSGEVPEIKLKEEKRKGEAILLQNLLNRMNKGLFEVYYFKNLISLDEITSKTNIIVEHHIVKGTEIIKLKDQNEAFMISYPTENTLEENHINCIVGFSIVNNKRLLEQLVNIGVQLIES